MAKKRIKNRRSVVDLKKDFISSWQYVKESKNFIYIVSAIFVIFVIIGYFIPAPAYIEKAILEFIEQLLEKTENMSLAELMSFIFFNNLQSSFFGMIFGIVFGVFSVLTVVINGYLLGFVSNVVVGEEGIVVLWRLLPHGIFELPAVLISLGLGLKLGTFIFKKNKIDSLKEFFLKSIKAFFFVIIPLLIIAAAIESALIFFFG